MLRQRCNELRSKGSLLSAAERPKLQAIQRVQVVPGGDKLRPNGLDAHLRPIQLDHRTLQTKLVQDAAQLQASLLAVHRRKGCTVADNLCLGVKLLQGSQRKIHWTPTFIDSTSLAFTRIFRITRLLSSGVASCSCSPRPLADSFSRKQPRFASMPARSARAFLTTSIDRSWLSFKFRFWLSSALRPA